MRKVMENGNSILLFPAGWVRTEEREVVPAHYSGAYETLKSMPGRPVVVLRIDGLGKFQFAKYDHFWSFIGKKKGRRHVNIAVDVFEDGLDTSVDLAEFKGLVACGGFSYGDVLGAGEGWAKSILFNSRARDFAKFGRLYLKRGNWDGRQLIPEAWVGDFRRQWAHSWSHRTTTQRRYLELRR